MFLFPISDEEMQIKKEPLKKRFFLLVGLSNTNVDSLWSFWSVSYIKCNSLAIV